MTSPQLHLWYITSQFVHIALHSIVRGKKSKLADRKLTNAGCIGGLQHVPVEGEYAGMADYAVVRFVIMEERPFIKPGSLKSPQNGFSQTFLGNGKCRGYVASEDTLSKKPY